MNKYKIYAKILGNVLPNQIFEIGNCKIEKMSYREQRKRKFRPLQGWTSVETSTGEQKKKIKYYLQFPNGADFRIMKSDFVISTVLNCSDDNEAIGLAEIEFNTLIGSLMLYMRTWWPQKFPKDTNRFSGYDFQICKVYKIIGEKEIEIKDPKPISTSSSMCSNPSFSEPLDPKTLQSYLGCRNEVFGKALKYFTNGVRGFSFNLPEEKIFLDLFKSIELVINSFKTRSRKFKQKLKSVASKLDLTEDEKNKIIEFWTIRSKGDFAHARKRQISLSLPPQYPISSDCNLFINYDELIQINQKVIVNYFNFIKDRYIISIKKPESGEGYNNLNHVIESFPLVTRWDNGYFEFKTEEKDKHKLTNMLKNKMSEYLKVSKKNIWVVSNKNNEIVLKTNE